MNNQANILTLFRDGLKSSSLERTKITLGDRKDYLGMSDLAQGLSCPRAIVAGKLSNAEFSFSLEKLLTLERGHWLEYGIEKALKATGVKLIPQLEISVIHQSTPIKAHLDLTLISESGDLVTVLELKSSEV
jgi:hypothetical protein